MPPANMQVAITPIQYGAERIAPGESVDHLPDRDRISLAAIGAIGAPAAPAADGKSDPSPEDDPPDAGPALVAALKQIEGAADMSMKDLKAALETLGEKDLAQTIKRADVDAALAAIAAEEDGNSGGSD